MYSYIKREIKLNNIDFTDIRKRIKKLIGNLME